MCSRTCPAWCARPGSVLFCFVLFCFCFVQCLGPAMGLALPDGPCPPRRALPPSMGPARARAPRWALPAACAWAPRWALPPTNLLALPGLPDGPARPRGARAARARGWRRLCGHTTTCAVRQASVWQASVWRALGGASYCIYYHY